ncbi:BQ2448_4577 [Microbotryum intermedium]|uniref:BQ2448_4577 protein n=1 Tax=Microbotryum intermedium TaxID=269621 RepID=A0A238FIQ3_9BASI|nr:BQ2448_4577 [Microbotryum intermedium]
MDRISTQIRSWASMRPSYLACSCTKSASAVYSPQSSAFVSRRSLSNSSVFRSALNSTTPYVYTSLPSRSLLSIGGQDVDKFLQGLITNDVARLQSRPTHALYAGVLKADGRALHDLFIYPSPTPSPTSTYLLDHPTEVSESFRKYLKRHILRSKVKLAQTASTTEQVQVAWKPRTGPKAAAHSQSDRSALEAEEWLQMIKALRDPRHESMGWRWVAEQGNAEQAPPSNLFQQVAPPHHHLNRLLLGIPEGQADLASLPLEGNLDFLGAIDFKKGCYVGQELTARTHHKGVVRKRQLPVRLFREGEDVPQELYPSHSTLNPYPELFPLPPPGSSLTPPSVIGTKAASRHTGRLHSNLPIVTSSGSSFALGLATIRLDKVSPDAQDGGVFVVKAELGEGEEQGWGAGESEMEGERWFAKAFLQEGGWLSRALKEERERKGAE